LLSLAEAPIQRIGEDHSLTRIGTEKDREFLIKSLISWFGENWIDRPGMKELGYTMPEIMTTFAQYVETEYGGTAGYIHDVLGLSAGSAEQIKTNILKK
jgi:Tyrosine phosphatase family